MELATYFPSSPNIDIAGCLNNGDAGDGVVFPGVETVRGAYCFVGRASVIEAAAELFDTTPEHVVRLLAEEDTTKQDLAAARKQVKELKSRLAQWENYAEAAREVGLSVPVVE